MTRRAASGLILCGGEARRMGGLDKPLQLLAGQPLIERTVECIRPQVAELIISANRNKTAYHRYSDKVLDDGAFRGRGPLAGLAAGLAAAANEWLVCVPGDAPSLPPDLVVRLLAALDDAGTSTAYVADGTGPQRLCCMVHTDLAADLHRYLASGGSVPGQWFARHRPAVADFNHWPLWGWSVNTPEQWEAAELKLAEGNVQ